jgi:hypothetical protein
MARGDYEPLQPEEHSETPARTLPGQDLEAGVGNGGQLIDDMRLIEPLTAPQFNAAQFWGWVFVIAFILIVIIVLGVLCGAGVIPCYSVAAAVASLVLVLAMIAAGCRTCT